MSDLTTLDNCLVKLIGVFQIYSKSDGDKSTLTKRELKELLEKEMPTTLGKSTDEEGLDKLFKELDGNSDGVVDFAEYVTMIGAIAMLCQDIFTSQD